MAGDWIKIEEHMPEKPEVATIAGILGIEDADTVAGKLVRVWAWASRNCNGDGVTKVTVMSQIDRCAGVTGFAKAMVEAGWLTVESDAITFPNFGRHCSKTAKERALGAKRAVTVRSRKSNGASVTKALPEKRREEKSNTRSLKTTRSKCTLDEAISFAAEIGLPTSDGESCWHKWQGNGWKNGTNAIKDWKATMRSWKAAGYMPSQKGGNNGPQKRSHRAGEYPQAQIEFP